MTSAFQGYLPPSPPVPGQPQALILGLQRALHIGQTSKPLVHAINPFSLGQFDPHYDTRIARRSLKSEFTASCVFAEDFLSLGTRGGGLGLPPRQALFF